MRPYPENEEMSELEMADLNGCFACGPENPSGLRLSFITDVSDPNAPRATSDVRLRSDYQGARGRVHGGIIATLMDEAMSKLNKTIADGAVTRHLSVEYLLPVPVGVTVHLTAQHLRREGRKLFHEAVLTDSEGHVLARAEALFLLIPSAPREVAFEKKV